METVYLQVTTLIRGGASYADVAQPRWWCRYNVQCACAAPPSPAHLAPPPMRFASFEVVPVPQRASPTYVMKAYKYILNKLTCEQRNLVTLYNFAVLFAVLTASVAQWAMSRL